MVVVEGPPGIGKTRILQAVATAAESRGYTILRARAAETERDHPFGVVRQLTDPALIAAASEEVEAFFADEAAAARSIFSGAGTTYRVYPVLRGLFALTVSLSRGGPVVLLVDDLQWADALSSTFLLFLTRRVAYVPVLLVAARRPAEPGCEPLSTELVAEPGVTLLRPPPLSLEGVAMVVTQALGGRSDVRFAEACREVTGGNPFLLTELLRELAARGVAPLRRNADEARSIRPAAVADMVRLRLARAPARARKIAEAVAVLESAAPAVVSTVAGVAGADRFLDVLAESGLLVCEQGSIRFAHPLLRSAVVASIPPRRRSRLHCLAAAVLADHGAASETIAAQLVATDERLDDRAVDALRSAAAEALARGDPNAAATALERAVRATSDPPAHLLCELGTAQARASRPQAVTTLERAVAAVGEPIERAGVARLLASGHLAAGRPRDAVAALEHALAGLADHDAELALQIKGDLSAMLLFAYGRHALEPLERYADRPGDTPGERVALALLAWSRSMMPGRLDEAVVLAERATATGNLLYEQGPDTPPFILACEVLVAGERFAHAEELLDQQLADARLRGSAIGVALGAGMRAISGFLRGDLFVADEYGRQAVEPVNLRDAPNVITMAIMGALHAMVERDELDDAQAVLRECDFERTPEVRAETAWMLSLGLTGRIRLRLAQRRAEEALEDTLLMERMHELLDHRYSRPPLNWRPLRVAALLALGRRGEALEVAQEDLEFATRSHDDRATGIALRGVALAGPEDRCLPLLAESAAWLEALQAPVELAWTLIEQGAALRRGNRPSQARLPLQRGLDLAEEAGAQRAASRAVAELAATGLHRHRAPEARGELTPSESRVAALAADGLSNKEIADALFVTVKTVETHLAAAYRKLGIRSRNALAEALKAAG